MSPVASSPSSSTSPSRGRLARRCAGALAALLLVVGAAACRDPLCVQTLRGTCPCRGPAGSPADTIAGWCFTTVEVVTCGPVDAAVVPCQLNPCCQAPAPSDGGADQRPGDAAVDGHVATGDAAPGG